MLKLYKYMTYKMIYYLLSFYLIMLSGCYFILSCLFMMFKFNILIVWNLINVLSFSVEFIMYFDWLMLMFFCVVSLISSMVFIYSLDYMGQDKYLNRFMLLILIFFISMKLMIISPNMLSILLGWDGLGLSSYCLIIFYQNKKSFNSGFITILMNRIGDISILLMISLLIAKNSLSFLFMWEINDKYLFFMVGAAMSKSAQIPFSYWLPLAMAAPTPVSSLVHSSTLVTAGVYLLIRFNYLLSGTLMFYLMVISCWTMFMASMSAMFEFDLKKIIALSTLSQLGLMILSISMGLIDLCFFHLITHAMFKSLLFLCSGIIIHNYFNNQDIRLISLININMPLVSVVFSVASLSLCGMPFLSGFYSKDLMIEYYCINPMNSITFNVMYLSMMNTMIYSFRLVFYIVLKPMVMSNYVKFNFFNLMNYSINLLFFMTIVYGSIINWLMFSSLNLIILSSLRKFMIYNLLLIGLLFAWLFFYTNNKLNLKSYYFFNYMWLFQVMGKKNKILLFKINNCMIMLKDSGWIENLSGKSLILYFIYMNKMETFSKVSFSMIMILISYSVMIMFFM